MCALDNSTCACAAHGRCGGAGAPRRLVLWLSGHCARRAGGRTDELVVGTSRTLPAGTQRWRPRSARGVRMCVARRRENAGGGGGGVRVFQAGASRMSVRVAWPTGEVRVCAGGQVGRREGSWELKSAWGPGVSAERCERNGLAELPERGNPRSIFESRRCVAFSGSGQKPPGNFSVASLNFAALPRIRAVVYTDLLTLSCQSLLRSPSPFAKSAMP